MRSDQMFIVLKYLFCGYLRKVGCAIHRIRIFGVGECECHTDLAANKWHALYQQTNMTLWFEMTRQCRFRLLIIALGVSPVMVLVFFFSENVIRLKSLKYPGVERRNRHISHNIPIDDRIKCRMHNGRLARSH